MKVYIKKSYEDGVSFLVWKLGIRAKFVNLRAQTANALNDGISQETLENQHAWGNVKKINWILEAQRAIYGFGRMSEGERYLEWRGWRNVIKLQHRKKRGKIFVLLSVELSGEIVERLSSWSVSWMNEYSGEIRRDSQSAKPVLKLPKLAEASGKPGVHKARRELRDSEKRDWV